MGRFLLIYFHKTIQNKMGNSKTKVRVMSAFYQCEFKRGDIGYIDGYVRGGNDIPFAVVVVKDKIDLVPIHDLEVLFD